MSEKKYTPGPWKVSEHSDEEESAVYSPNDSIGLQVCGMRPLQSCANVQYISLEQREANAHLIAAAPELLEALEKIVKEGRDYMDRRGCRKIWWIDEAEQAIRKAHGESEGK
jgi:hypothetical protein